MFLIYCSLFPPLIIILERRWDSDPSERTSDHFSLPVFLPELESARQYVEAYRTQKRRRLVEKTSETSNEEVKEPTSAYVYMPGPPNY